MTQGEAQRLYALYHSGEPAAQPAIPETLESVIAALTPEQIEKIRAAAAAI